MTPEEFSEKRLKKENRYYEELAHTLSFLKKERVMEIKRRDSTLLETLQDMLRRRILPVVDKKLGFVFGVGECNHLMMRTSLFRYHHADGKGYDVPHVPPRDSADAYIQQGMGYFFSSMLPNTIIVSPRYKQHPDDKDVFLAFRQDESYE